MTGFLLGIASSFLAGILFYLCRFMAGPVVNVLFFRMYPNVSGRYQVLIDPMLHTYPNQKTYLVIKQFANRIRGYMEDYSDEDFQSSYGVSGRVTQTRMIVLWYDCKTPGHHDYGTGVFKLSPDGKSAYGHTTSLCTQCESIDSRDTKLKRLEANA